MRRVAIPVMLAAVLAVGCEKRPATTTSGTLAELRAVEPDVEEATVDRGLDQAMEGYRRFLEEAPETRLTPEAIRRLADLQLEKEFGIHGGNQEVREMAAPEIGVVPVAARTGGTGPGATAADPDARESDRDFEARTTAESRVAADTIGAAGTDAPPSGPGEAIALYDQLLAEYPNYEHRDKVLYQKARAFDELGRTEEAIATMEELSAGNPSSEHYDEVQFRRGEYFFTRRRFYDAEKAYGAILAMGAGSSEYYEFALYKLGWTLYKQELYEDALHRYVALLDYKISIGYEFDATQEEEDERRVADTFRVISLSFSNLGGPQAVEEYFSKYGTRSFEDRVYANLGEHYLAKLRYDDAAKTYRAFVTLHPYHRKAPHFSMQVIETFIAGEFPKLVLEAKREFATTYALDAEYWRHFTPEDRAEVLANLKTNLNDLATHYHAVYQDTEEAEDKVEAFAEAHRWYGDYLQSFPEDGDTPPIHYRWADLLLEHGDFKEAALAYERTAYDYPTHEQSAAAGYAAVYAHRERLKAAGEDAQGAVKRDAVASSIRFADTFPEHDQAAAVLGAAADDQYEMHDYAAAVVSGRRVVDDYPEADGAIRRAAWIVVAHGSFDLAEYAEAEQAYTRVLAVTAEDDESQAGFVDNLAASIYKQGELANEADDPRAAADHFLRIRTAAPTSTIRPTAEYDAGAALVALEDWTAAASVLESFRDTYTDHELQLEATRLIARSYRENGELSRAAGEYERIADGSEDPLLRGDALLVAGDLHEQAGAPDRALAVYTTYVEEFPEPVEMAIETRFKIAGIHDEAGYSTLYREELEELVRIEAQAGPERTGRTRTLAGRSALVLAEHLYGEFEVVELRQPFEESLQEKRRRMDLAMGAMERLVDYEIADLTAAATFYMAEGYFEFSRALNESERPTDLDAAELAEYELVLEENAFPFEEKAIDFHEKNLELLQAGVFNDWTENSLGRLAELVPGRYAKDEIRGGYLAEIDRYEYRSPASEVFGPPADAAGASPEDDPQQPVQTTRLIKEIATNEEVDDALAP
jgi:tetratricopeptide (TPR) repeat protein